MNGSHVIFQMLLLGECLVWTYFTLEWLHLLVNCCDVTIKIALCAEGLVAFITFEWTHTQMNLFNMFVKSFF